MRATAFLAVFFLMAACKNKQEKDGADKILLKDNLLQTDKAFAEMCRTQGYKTAYLHYLDSNGVLLRPANLPLKGSEAIQNLSQLDDGSFSMKWQPDFAEISAAADIGYTYGTYSITIAQPDTIIYGTYVNIWKKNENGNWRLVLNSGNDGIEESQE